MRRDQPREQAYEALHMTRRDLGHVQNSVRDAHAYLSADADRDVFSRFNLSKPSAKTILDHGRRTVGVGAGAAGAGYLQGRANTVNLLGTPVPTGFALAMGAWLIAYLGENHLGSFADDLYNMGDGAFASWATILGMSWGQNARLAAGEATGPIVAGRAPAVLPSPAPFQGVRPLSEAEVYAASRRR